LAEKKAISMPEKNAENNSDISSGSINSEVLSIVNYLAINRR
jgi:hypothetical protein